MRFRAFFLCFQMLEALSPVSTGERELSGVSPQTGHQGHPSQLFSSFAADCPFGGNYEDWKVCYILQKKEIRNVFNDGYILIYLSFMRLIMILCVFRTGLPSCGIIPFGPDHGCRWLLCSLQDGQQHPVSSPPRFTQYPLSLSHDN